MRRLEGYQKGINVGGWLSQGPRDKKHLDTFIQEEDIKTIASWGADHIRLPLDYENVENEDGTVKESGYAYIDNCIDWCQKYHLNIVLDLHKTYGYIFDDPAYSEQFFYDEQKQDRFVALWEKLAARYAKYSDRMMFELLNEVTSLEVVDEWNALALRCTKAIRKYAPTVKILYGGVGYNAVTSIKKLLPPIDEHIVYNFHCYEPLIFTHQTAHWVEDMPADFHISYPGNMEEYLRISKTIKGAMTGALAEAGLQFSQLGPDFFETIFADGIQTAEERNVPLYCGEYGVIDQTSPEDAMRWFSDINQVFSKYGIGRAIWSYKEMDFGIAGEHYDAIRDELLQHVFS